MFVFLVVAKGRGPDSGWGRHADTPDTRVEVVEYSSEWAVVGESGGASWRSSGGHILPESSTKSLDVSSHCLIGINDRRNSGRSSHGDLGGLGLGSLGAQRLDAPVAVRERAHIIV